MPRFTVLMPTHNRADVVGYAIRSMLDQTERDFELLIVGDGCTDNTAEVVAGLGDPRIIWFDLPKAPGFGYANRNVALRKARGELVAYAPHDDLLLPDHLEILGGAIAAEKVDWIHGKPLWVTRTGVIIPTFVNLANTDEMEIFMTRSNGIPAGAIVHRLDCFERFGYWPEDIERGGDWSLWRRFIGSGATHRSLRVPTMLHFTANWRRQQGAGSAMLTALLQLAERKAWWPSGLSIAIPEGKTEQSVIYQAMAEGGAEWCRGLRADVDEVVHRLARDMAFRFAKKEIKAREGNSTDRSRPFRRPGKT